jgi:thymidylate kinase
MTVKLFRKPVVIVFIGYEGAGKTTHILLTCNKLKEIGIKPYCTYVKTIFLFTNLFTKFMPHLWRSLWRLAVSIDLLLNSILLPLVWTVRTLIIPTFSEKQVVLVEEGLYGSLVDYIHAALILNLWPITYKALKILFVLFRNVRENGIVYVWCDPSILPLRWIKRKSPLEAPSYIFTQIIIFSIITNTLNNILQIDTTNFDMKHNNEQIIKYIFSLLNSNK